MISTLSFDTALWMTVIYAMCAGFCVMADNRCEISNSSLESQLNLWRWYAATLFLMALNVLLRIDVEFVLWARTVTKSAGWYDMRRAVQLAALLMLMGCLALCVKALQEYLLKWRLKHVSTASMIAFAGLLLLAVLLALRLVNFHYTDQVMNWRLGGLRMDRWIELFGLTMVMVGATAKVLQKG
jgi:hypothetical protein